MQRRGMMQAMTPAPGVGLLRSENSGAQVAAEPKPVKTNGALEHPLPIRISCAPRLLREIEHDGLRVQLFSDATAGVLHRLNSAKWRLGAIAFHGEGSIDVEACWLRPERGVQSK